MWATYWDVLKEFGGRKVLIVLGGLALGIGFLYNRSISFGEVNGVPVIFQGPVSLGPPPFAVPVILGQMSTITGMTWVLLMIFAGCPLFVTSLEKGWRELTFSKGTPRWQIFLARYLASATLFFLLVLISDLPVALRFWWQTGIPALVIVGGVLIQTFSFASLLAIGALVSLPGEHVAMPIIVPVGMMVLSQLLVNRAALYESYITSYLGRLALDWVYYILPKCTELQFAAATFIQSSGLPTAWPVWTTGVFILATLSMTLWLLERKSF